MKTNTTATLHSFKITNIRQLDSDWNEVEREAPVTHHHLNKVLLETIIGEDVRHFEDFWTGDESIDVNIFDNSVYGDPEKLEGYSGTVYAVLTDDEGNTSQGGCIASFDIELNA